MTQIIMCDKEIFEILRYFEIKQSQGNYLDNLNIAVDIIIGS